MADNTYGSRDRNIFNAPESFEVNGITTKSNIGSNRKFYTLVDSVTGDITIKEYNGISSTLPGGNVSLDRTIGTIPKDNTFQPIQGVTTFDEIAYFSSAIGQKNIKNHAVITAQKAGAQNAQQLIFPNSATSGAGEGQNIPIGGDDIEDNNRNQTTPRTIEDVLQLRTIEAVPLNDMDKVDIDNTRYPLDMKGMDAVLFTRKKYTPVDFNKETVGFNRNNQENTTPQGRVILGIQPSVRDTNTVSWQGLTLNMFETAMADFFYSAAGGGSSGIEGFTKRAEESLKQGGANLRSGVLSLIGQEAVGTKGLTSRLTGGVFNPNLELLFQGPELRTFNFNFNLTPRRKLEADAIKRIIKFFKKGMAVQRTSAELFLKAPHVFDIEYKLNGTDQIHPSLNKIKTCALVSCSVDYTPTNSYMTFNDDRGTPVQYNLSLTFQELTPVYADEYDDEDNHEIGY